MFALERDHIKLIVNSNQFNKLKPIEEILKIIYPFNFLIVGKKILIMPIKGKNEQIKKTSPILVLSANFPKSAEPKAPIPNANPKKSPDTIPTLPGSNSWA